MNQHLTHPAPSSPAFIHRRRSYTFLPILLLPFLAIFFAAVKGMVNPRQTPSQSGSQSEEGLNTSLPDPHFKPGPPENKLSLYARLEQDSLRQTEQKRRDSALYDDSASIARGTARRPGRPGASADPHDPLSPDPSLPLSASPTTRQIREKLDLLRQILRKSSDKPSRENTASPSLREPYTPPGLSSSNPSLPRLEKLLRDLRTEHPADPEIADLDRMLDKIMAIQRPNSASTDPAGATSPNAPHASPEGFALGKPSPDSSERGSLPGAVEAFLPETQSLRQGSTVKLQLISEVRVQERIFPKGAWLYGIAALENERCRITVRSIRGDRVVLPVSLEVYDLDGIEGIYMPGLFAREAGQQSADQSLNAIGLRSFDASAGAQAANAGIQTARTLLGKRVRRLQVRVKAGYRVFLRDNHARTPGKAFAFLSGPGPAPSSSPDTSTRALLNLPGLSDLPANTHGIGDSRDGITLSVRGLYIHGDRLLVRLECGNSSPIAYRIASLHCFIKDKRRLRRNATQEIVLEADCLSGESPSIPAATRQIRLLSIPVFTIPEGRYGGIEMMEEGNGRRLLCILTNRDLIRARRLED